jgi:predicted Zn-dependent protease
VNTAVKRLSFLPLLVAAAVFVAGCYTVPQTGRRSLNLLSVGQEMQLGAASFSQIKQQEKISTDPIANERVRRVGERIAAAAKDDLPRVEWEFVVFDAPDTINAFALPGGKVGVYTGLLKVAESDDELAVVMGHEIAHVTARHGAERLSQSLAIAAGGLVLSEAALRDSQHRDLILAAYGLGSTVGVILPFSRNNESEADEIGLIYSSKAGYDPRAALSFWRKMAAAKEGRSGPPEWLSTHPSDATRIRRIEALLPRVIPLYEEAQKRLLAQDARSTPGE